MEMSMIRASVLLGILAVAAIAPAASAHDGARPGSSSPSVFPVQRDPWRSWGVRNGPQHPGPPRAAGAVVGVPVVRRVWVPGQWVSDGFRWLWAPGHWAPVAH